MELYPIVEVLQERVKGQGGELLPSTVQPGWVSGVIFLNTLLRQNFKHIEGKHNQNHL
jgi:hypothetical protein